MDSIVDKDGFVKATVVKDMMQDLTAQSAENAGLRKENTDLQRKVTTMANKQAATDAQITTLMAQIADLNKAATAQANPAAAAAAGGNAQGAAAAVAVAGAGADGKIKLVPPTFGGEESLVRAVTFLADVKAYQTGGNLTQEALMTVIAGQCMREKAKRWFENQSLLNPQIRADFAFFERQFRDRYAPRLEGGNQALIDLRQADDESVSNFLDRCVAAQLAMDTGEPWYEDFTEAQKRAHIERMVVKAFKAGLTNKNGLKEKITAALLSDLEENVQRAKALEAAYGKPEEKRTSKPTAIVAEVEEVAVIDKRRSQGAQKSKTLTKKIEGRCWHCHKIGHMTRDCRSKKRGEPPSPEALAARPQRFGSAQGQPQTQGQAQAWNGSTALVPVNKSKPVGEIYRAEQGEVRTSMWGNPPTERESDNQFSPYFQ